MELKEEILKAGILESIKGQEELLNNFNDTTKIGIKWFFNYV